jgi:hypothetical protein
VDAAQAGLLTQALEFVGVPLMADGGRGDTSGTHDLDISTSRQPNETTRTLYGSFTHQRRFEPPAPTSVFPGKAVLPP